MNLLTEIVSSRARAEVLRLLFDGRDAEIHNREIERRSCVSESTLRRELTKLSRLELLKRRRDGNRTYYSANRQHPLYPDVRNLVLKTAGLVDVLRAALEGHSIRVALVFGSVARGDEKAGSDVDVLIIGDTSLRQIAALLAGVQATLSREVNPHVFSPREYRNRLAAKDHFLTSLRQGAKVFVIGTEDDLAAMA